MAAAVWFLVLFLGGFFTLTSRRKRAKRWSGWDWLAVAMLTTGVIIWWNL
jgi:hypothetical protein